MHKDGPEWIAGSGTADAASNRPNTANTLFRIGSTSKAFAALSVLMQVNPGRLSLDDPVRKLVPEPAPNADDYVGWYEPDSPRVEMLHFLERLLGLSRIKFHDGKLVVSSVVGGRKESFLPVTAAQFRRVPEKDPPEPVSTLALLSPNAEGRFIQANVTMRKMPTWLAIVAIFTTAFVILSTLAITVYAPFWILRGISKRRRRHSERPLRLYPWLAVLSLLGIFGIFALSISDLIERMGNLTVWSAAVCILTLVFATSTASVFSSWQSPAEGVGAGCVSSLGSYRWLCRLRPDTGGTGGSSG